MRVLIAYGSRWGSTEEIANRLAGFLGKKGVKVDLLDVKKKRGWPSLEGYDGVMRARIKFKTLDFCQVNSTVSLKKLKII